MGRELRDLGTARLRWRDLFVIVQGLPRTSALVREIQGEDHLWGLPEQLLAAIADALHGANWQRGQGKKSDMPKPIPRPGVVQAKQFGGQAVSMEEMAARLERRRHLAVVADPPQQSRDSRGRFAKN